jgi:hypothetical protein
LAWCLFSQRRARWPKGPDKTPADKFELTAPQHAPFLIWTSPAGLLLDFSEQDNHGKPKEQGMKLIRYRQWLNF